MKKLLIFGAIIVIAFIIISNVNKSTEPEVSEEEKEESETKDPLTHDEIVNDSSFNAEEKGVLIKLNTGIKQSELTPKEQIVAVKIATKGRG